MSLLRTFARQPARAQELLCGRKSWLAIVVLVCFWCQPTFGDHVPGLAEGPYPGLRVPTATGPTVDVSTEAELIAAISNDTIKVAHLVNDLRLEAKGWPLLPILRNASFTISGDRTQLPILVSPAATRQA